MNAGTPINLHKLPLLGELFSLLNSGRHLNRLAEQRLWAELERERDAYEQLFGALGYRLRLDERGFAWFQIDEASSNVSKTTRQLALLFMVIFEFQADVGRHLGRFTDWLIDAQLLDAVVAKNRPLLAAEGLAAPELLEQLLKTAGNYGFTALEGSSWRLLPAVFRYLDRFEELAREREPTDGAPAAPALDQADFAESAAAALTDDAVAEDEPGAAESTGDELA